MPHWVETVWDWMNSPIGSGLTVAAIIAVLAASFRRSRAFIARAYTWLRSLRLTTTTAQVKAIRDAVEAATTAPAWEEEDPADRAVRMREEWFSGPWAVVRYFGEKHAYHLENRTAGAADGVTLKSKLGDFEFLTEPAWDSIPQGEYRQFLGRIARGPFLGIGTPAIDVEWIDAHGDARTFRVTID